MTTHPVPVGTGNWQSSNLPDVDDLDIPLTAASVDGDPHDRPAPLPRREPGVAGTRAAAIAAIHAYADFLEAHPDIPAPISLDGNVHQHGDFDESVTVVRGFIQTYGARKYTDGPTGWATLRISDTGSPVIIRHSIFTGTKRDAGGWL